MVEKKIILIILLVIISKIAFSQEIHLSKPSYFVDTLFVENASVICIVNNDDRSGWLLSLSNIPIKINNKSYKNLIINNDKVFVLHFGSNICLLNTFKDFYINNSIIISKELKKRLEMTKPLLQKIKSQSTKNHKWVYFTINTKKYALFLIRGDVLRKCSGVHGIKLKGTDNIYFKVLFPIN